MIQAPFADFTWRHARQILADRGGDDTDQSAIARVLDELLQRAGNGPTGRKTTDRVIARTKAATATTPRSPVHAAANETAEPETDAEGEDVVPFGVFDSLTEDRRLW